MKININPKQWENIIANYLLDMILNPEFIKNDNFYNLINKIENSGLKSLLFNYYLSMNSADRLNYKRINDPIHDENTDKDSIIKISNNLSNNESDNFSGDEYKIKYLIKETLKKINKIKYRKNRMLTESEVDKIINSILKEN